MSATKGVLSTDPTSSYHQSKCCSFVKITGVTIFSALTVITLIGGTLCICTRYGVDLGKLNMYAQLIEPQWLYVGVGITVGAGAMDVVVIIAMVRHSLNRIYSEKELHEFGVIEGIEKALIEVKLAIDHYWKVYKPVVRPSEDDPEGSPAVFGLVVKDKAGQVYIKGFKSVEEREAFIRKKGLEGKDGKSAYEKQATYPPAYIEKIFDVNYLEEQITALKEACTVPGFYLTATLTCRDNELQMCLLVVKENDKNPASIHYCKVDKVDGFLAAHFPTFLNQRDAEEAVKLAAEEQVLTELDEGEMWPFEIPYKGHTLFAAKYVIEGQPRFYFSTIDDTKDRLRTYTDAEAAYVTEFYTPRELDALLDEEAFAACRSVQIGFRGYRLVECASKDKTCRFFGVQVNKGTKTETHFFRKDADYREEWVLANLSDVFVDVVTLDETMLGEAAVYSKATIESLLRNEHDFLTYRFSTKAYVILYKNESGKLTYKWRATAEDFESLLEKYPAEKWVDAQERFIKENCIEREVALSRLTTKSKESYKDISYLGEDQYYAKTYATEKGRIAFLRVQEGDDTEPRELFFEVTEAGSSLCDYYIETFLKGRFIHANELRAAHKRAVDEHLLDSVLTEAGDYVKIDYTIGDDTVYNYIFAYKDQSESQPTLQLHSIAYLDPARSQAEARPYLKKEHDINAPLPPELARSFLSEEDKQTIDALTLGTPLYLFKDCPRTDNKGSLYVLIVRPTDGPEKLYFTSAEARKGYVEKSNLASTHLQVTEKFIQIVNEDLYKEDITSYFTGSNQFATYDYPMRGRTLFVMIPSDGSPFCVFDSAEDRVAAAQGLEQVVLPTLRDSYVQQVTEQETYAQLAEKEGILAARKRHEFILEDLPRTDNANKIYTLIYAANQGGSWRAVTRHFDSSEDRKIAYQSLTLYMDSDNYFTVNNMGLEEQISDSNYFVMEQRGKEDQKIYIVWSRKDDGKLHYKVYSDEKSYKTEMEGKEDKTAEIYGFDIAGFREATKKISSDNGLEKFIHNDRFYIASVILGHDTVEALFYCDKDKVLRKLAFKDKEEAKNFATRHGLTVDLSDNANAAEYPALLGKELMCAFSTWTENRLLECSKMLYPNEFYWFVVKTPQVFPQITTDRQGQPTFHYFRDDEKRTNGRKNLTNGFTRIKNNEEFFRVAALLMAKEGNPCYYVVEAKGKSLVQLIEFKESKPHSRWIKPEELPKELARLQGSIQITEASLSKVPVSEEEKSALKDKFTVPTLLPKSYKVQSLLNGQYVVVCSRSDIKEAKTVVEYFRKDSDLLKAHIASLKGYRLQK